MIGQNAPTDDGDRFARTIADLRARVADLERTRTGIVPWTAPTLINSWVNYGGTYRTARYRKIGDRVEIEGLVKSGTIGATVFTLPVGYRPPQDIPFGVHSNNAFGSLIVFASGAVYAQAGSNASFGLTCSFSVTA